MLDSVNANVIGGREDRNEMRVQRFGCRGAESAQAGKPGLALVVQSAVWRYSVERYEYFLPVVQEIDIVA